MRIIALLFALCALYPPASAAGAFSVTPVKIHMGARERAVAIQVVNLQDAPLELRAEVLVRSAPAQDLEPSDDFVLSPPVLRLAPRARQVVRLVRLAPVVRGEYRLFLREVPQPGPHTGMRIRLVLNIPVLVAGAP